MANGSAWGSNFNVGSPPSGPIQQPFFVPNTTSQQPIGQGAPFNPANPVPQNNAVGIPANSGAATSGLSNIDMLGLGGPLVNPNAFAAPNAPTGGTASGTNLQPSVASAKGANDIANFNPATWFPGIMTLFHITRKPGGQTSQ